MTVLAPNWDFFSFYMTLVMTPMMMISGVFFPAEQLPRAARWRWRRRCRSTTAWRWCAR